MKDTDYYDKKTGKGGELAPRNFLTNPPIKGHKGLLGCKKSSDGVVGEYHYEPEPPLPRKPRTAPPVPFKPSHPGKKGLFSQEPKANFTTLSYSTEGPREKPSKFEPLSKPWSPSRVNPIKGPTGRIYATINPPPNYEPIGPKPAFKDTRVNDPAKNVAHAWKPNSSSKSMRSCSIVNMKRNVMSANSAF